MTSDQIQQVISALLFFVIPTFTGYFINQLFVIAKTKLLKRTLKNIQEKNSVEYITLKLGEYFVYGALVIFTIIFLFHNYLASNTFELAVKTVYVITALGIGLFVLEKFIGKNKTIEKYLEINYVAIFIVVVLAVAVYKVWRIDAPAFSSLNWDLYHHQLLVNQILHGKFSVLTTQLSDTFQFGGYTTMFHSLMAVSQSMFNVNILEYWFYIEFFYFLFTLFVAYSVAQILFKNKLVSVLAVILCALSFESNSAYTSFFLIPQNITATLVALFVARTIKRFENGLDGLDNTSVIFIIFATLMHLIIGPTGLTFMLFVIMWVALKNVFKQKAFDEESPRLDWILSGVAVLLLVIFPVVVNTMDLSYLNRGEAQYFNFSFNEKMEYFQIFLGYLPLVLLPLGLIGLLTEKNTKNKMIFVMIIGMLTVIVSPIPYSLKFISYSRYFIYPTMAFGIWFLIKELLNGIENKIVRVGLSGIVVVLLLVSMGGIFVANAAMYKQVPTYKNLATHVTQNEIYASNFIKERYNSASALLVADPATMHIVETLSGLNSPGGAYTDQNTRKVISDVFFSRDSETLSKELFQIKDGLNPSDYDKIVFVISGRFTKWQLGSTEEKNGIFWNVWTPYDLTLEGYSKYDFLDFITNFSSFKEVYRNQGVIVLELSKQ